MAVNKDQGGKKGPGIVSKLAVGAVGVAAGVAAIALTDEKNRKKVGKFVSKVRIEGDKLRTAMRNAVEEGKKKGQIAEKAAKKKLSAVKRRKKN